MALTQDFRIKEGIEFLTDNADDIGNSGSNRPANIYVGTDVIVGGSSVLVDADVGVNVQAYDAGLADIAGLAVTDSNFIVGNGSNWVVESGATARASLGAQAQDAFLDDIAALTDPNADRILFWDDSAGAITFLTVGSNLSITTTTLNATSGVSAINDLSDVTITSVANDEILQYTGAGWENQTLSEAGIQPADAGLTDIAGLAVTDGNIIVGNGSNWVAESGATARTSLGLGTGDSPTFAGSTNGNIQVGVTGDNEIDTSSGNLTIDSAGGTVTLDDDVTITGSLTVNGATVTNSATNTTIEDALIELGSGNAGANTNDLGLILERGTTGDNGFIGWDESADAFVVGTTTATGASTGSLTFTAAAFTAGAITGSSGSFTGDLAFGTLTDTGESISITKFVDAADGIASNDNDTTIPTTAAIKAYVDSSVGGAGDVGFGTGGLVNQVAYWSSAGAEISGDTDFTFNPTSGVVTATELVARAVSGSTTTGALATSDANKKTTLTGDITVNSGYAVDDVVILDPNGTARTVTVGTGVTLYVNGTAKAATDTFTTPANGLVSIAWRSSTVGIVTGIETSPQLAPQSANTTTTTQTAVWTTTAADYDVVKLTVKVNDTVAGELHATEILVTHDGTTAVGTEYATIFTGSATLATFDVDINTGNIRLLATSASTNSTDYVVQASPVIA